MVILGPVDTLGFFLIYEDLNLNPLVRSQAVKAYFKAYMHKRCTYNGRDVLCSIVTDSNRLIL